MGVVLQDPRLPSTDDALPFCMPAPSPGRAVVLVVDDHSWIRRIIEQSLSRDYCILQAANGKEAMRYLKLIKVDLVLTDLIMPEMGGLALAREVRATYPDLPIVFVSAHLDGDTVREARSISPHYVTKPFGVEDLQKKIRRIIEAGEGNLAD